MAWRDKGDLAHAVVDFGEAIRINPRGLGAIVNRANAHRDLGDFDSALADYGEALQLNPRNTFALSSRGLARLRRGELDASIADFDAALALNPGLANSLYGRAIAKRRKGRPRGRRRRPRRGESDPPRCRAGICEVRDRMSRACFSQARSCSPSSPLSAGAPHGGAQSRTVERNSFTDGMAR
jgi:tetratricopeptide (TPR) repeat protein